MRVDFLFLITKVTGTLCKGATAKILGFRTLESSLLQADIVRDWRWNHKVIRRDVT